jgi:murein DD-endopeptidase MepM/ murein hydrolase activator NlpD
MPGIAWNSMKRLLAVNLLFLLLAPSISRRIDPVSRPVYIVQAGDSYWRIADTFKVTIDDLLTVNGLSGNHVINPGDRLAIPGYDGIAGILSTRMVELGETIGTLSLRYGVPEDVLLRLNRLVSRERLYAGQTLIIVEPEEGSASVSRWESGKALSTSAGMPLVAQAAAEGKNPWELAEANRLSSQADQYSGETLLSVGGDRPLRSWPAPIENIQFRSLPLVQGKTSALHVTAPAGSQAEGTLGDWKLVFRVANGQLVALQGMPVQAKPKTYPLVLKVTLPDGRSVYFQQDVLLISGNYITEDVDLRVPPETIDSATIQSEGDEMQSVVAPFTEERFWQGLFLPPVPGKISSYFGNWRTYNGGSYATFHSGVDLYAQEKEPIHAPAAGRVVFTENRVICGNTTVIDHGWGVYTRYCHQSKIEVQVGEMVQAGQEIGLIGHTGRSDGPHLHWEVWVGGVQVNPLQWLEEEFP